MNVLSEIEQERDLAWFRSLLMRELKLNAGDWVFLLAVVNGTIPHEEHVLMGEFWDHMLVAALTLSSVKYGIRVNPDREWTSVEDQWSSLQGKIGKYLKLVGRVPA